MRPALEFIKELFKDLPEITGVEVGVYEGLNAKAMLDEMPNPKTLYLVDNGSQDLMGLPKMKVEPKERLSGYSNRIKWHDMDSVKAALLIPDNSLDFCYIDADHQYESVKQDIEVWNTKVKAGGVICGHDYNYENFGVKRAVEERFWPRNTGLISDWWKVKK